MASLRQLGKAPNKIGGKIMELFPQCSMAMFDLPEVTHVSHVLDMPCEKIELEV